jgi:hypothetical protein
VKDSETSAAIEGCLLKETATVKATQHNLLHNLIECILPIVITLDSVLLKHLLKDF